MYEDLMDRDKRRWEKQLELERYKIEQNYGMHHERKKILE